MARIATPPDVKLTARQREVLDLVSQGKTNFEIAEALGVSLNGAKWHLRELFTKLNVDSREEAATWWREQRSPGRQFVRALRGLAFSLPMRWLLAGGLAGVAVGTATVMLLAAWPGRSDSPQASPVALSPTAPSANVIDDRTCDSGVLINGFLVLHGIEPRPSCIVSETATAPQKVYQLDLPPNSGFQQVGSAGLDSTGRIEYQVQAADGRMADAITLTVARTYDSPPAVQGDEQTVTSTDLFPGPSILITRPGTSTVGASWVEPSGLYSVTIDSALTSLTIEQVAGLLGYYDGTRNAFVGWDPQAGSETVGATPWAYPSDATTGIKAVDATLHTIAAPDAPGLAQLAHTTGVPCQPAQTGILAPAACPEGVAAGANVEGYWFGCDSNAGGVVANAEYLFGSTVHGGAGMYLMAVTKEPAGAPAHYAAILTDGKTFSLFWIDDDGPTGVGWQCDASIVESPPAGGRFLLPPLLKPPIALHGVPAPGP